MFRLPFNQVKARGPFQPQGKPEIFTRKGAQWSSGWTPSALSVAPLMWYNDTSAVTDAGAGACSQWNDLSTNAWHMVQATGARRPLIVSGGLNSRRTIRFNGTTAFLATSGAPPRGVFRNASYGYSLTVFKKLATDAGSIKALLYAAQGVGDGRFMTFVSNTLTNANKSAIYGTRLDGGATTTTTAPTASGTEWRMELAVFDWANGTATLYRDGAQIVTNPAASSAGNTSNTASADDITLGANRNGGAAPIQHADIEVGEMINGASALATADIDKLFGYTAWRWGLQANLPAGHPYRWYAP